MKCIGHMWSIERLPKRPCILWWARLVRSSQRFLHDWGNKIWNILVRLHYEDLTACQIVKDMGLRKGGPKTERKKFVKWLRLLRECRDALLSYLEMVIVVSRVDHLRQFWTGVGLLCRFFDCIWWLAIVSYHLCYYYRQSVWKRWKLRRFDSKANIWTFIPSFLNNVD